MDQISSQQSILSFLHDQNIDDDDRKRSEYTDSVDRIFNVIVINSFVQATSASSQRPFQTTT